MNRNKVLFLPHNIEIEILDGQNLIRGAIEAGVHINASCGGGGVCGKCRVIVEKGKIEGGINEKLSKLDIKNNFRLACKSYVTQNVVIRIPPESGTDFKVFKSGSLRRTAKIIQMNLDNLKEKDGFSPPIKKIFLEMSKPSSSDRLPDVSRIANHLKNYFDEEHLQFDLPVIRKIPDIIRKNNFRITVTLAKSVKTNSKTRIINIQTGNTVNNNFAIAMDIGTTTIYGQLIDLNTGHVISEYGTINKQISYGDDIIARIIFAEKHEGLEKINKVLIETINDVIFELIKNFNSGIDNISIITFAGNTTMTQLLLKINPRNIRISPYIPASTLYPPFSAIDLGISLNEHVLALVYPSVSSYVGGDIVAGIISSGMYTSKKLTLFIDIGTNAEIVIGNKEWLLCAACSAGPSFEGGGIEFGVRASLGAIEDFSIDPVSLEPMLMTIGDTKPKGICGSGLITIVAVLFEMDIIDNAGKFNRDLSTHRIRQRNRVYEYVLAWSNETQINRDIVITEVDINNLIRTKGAIFSGCITLLNEMSMTTDDIEQIIIAGGFGSYVDLDKAMVIGLLPEIDTNKVTFIGNSSLMGAKMISIKNKIRKDVGNVVRRMTSCELSEVPSYMNNYVASLFIPHTNLDMFPKLTRKLKFMKKNKLKHNL